MNAARPSFIPMLTLFLNLGLMLHPGTEIRDLVTETPETLAPVEATTSRAAPAETIPASLEPVALETAPIQSMLPVFGLLPIHPAQSDASMSMDVMACSSADGALLGPCARAGCSGRDDYCKSYVVFDFLGMTLYRHCTGEMRERIVNPNRR